MPSFARKLPYSYISKKDYLAHRGKKSRNKLIAGLFGAIFLFAGSVALFSQTSPGKNFLSKAAITGTLPDPWQMVDKPDSVTGTNLEDQITIENGVYTVKTDFWNYIYRPMCDGEVSVRILGIDPRVGSLYSSPELFISQANPAVDPFLFVKEGMLIQVEPTNTNIRINPVWITQAGQINETVKTIPLAYPVFIKLSEFSNVFTASYSLDGTTWNTITTRTIAIQKPHYVGIVNRALNNSTIPKGLTGSQFDMLEGREIDTSCVPSPTPSTPTDVTPTTISVECDCLVVKAYTEQDNVWTDVSQTLSSLAAGNHIYFSLVLSSGTDPSKVSKARFRVNGIPTEWSETSFKNPYGEFSYSFTIPEAVYTFDIQAQLYHEDLGWR